MNTQAPIGVFDSGVGGLSILRALRAELPAEDFVYIADAGFAPYGERGDAYVVERSGILVRRLLQEHRAKAIVVACNTATAAAIHLLREQYPQVPLIGVEPALKPAIALTRTRRIAVLGTRGTLSSAKFRSLHESLSGEAEFIIQPCDGLADAIENNDSQRVARLCELYLQPLAPFGTRERAIDTLVLGCTHYPFAQSQLLDQVGHGIQLIETGAPVARQTRRLLAAAGRLRRESVGGVQLLSTGSQSDVDAAGQRWLGL